MLMDRKEQIIEAATELLQTRSFSSFSYQDLSERLGITKASIHHHFRSKKDLGTAVADRYHEDVKALLNGAMAQHDDPWHQLNAYFAMVTEILRTGEKICAAGSLQAEVNVVPGDMAHGMASVVRFVVSWIADVLAAGRRRGVMEFPGLPQDQAATVFCAMQGGLQLGRAQGQEKLRIVIKQIGEAMKPRTAA